MYRHTYKVCFATSLVTLLALAVWVATDPFFHVLVDWAWRYGWTAWKLPLLPIAHNIPSWPRYLLLCALGTLAILSTLMAMVSGCFRGLGGATIRSWMAAILLLAVWLAAVVNYDDFERWALRARLRASLAAFEPIVRHPWPEGVPERLEGVLADGRTYHISTDYEEFRFVSLSDSGVPSLGTELPGPMLFRGPEGVLRVYLQSSHRDSWWLVEFHPHSTSPESFELIAPRTQRASRRQREFELRNAWHLDGPWWLAEYDHHWPRSGNR